MRHITRAEEELIVNSILGERLPNCGPQAPYTEVQHPRYKIGSPLKTPDGLTWHYCKCGSHGIAAVFRDRGAASLVIPETRAVIGAHAAGSYQVVINDANVAHGVDYWANGKVELWSAVVAEHMHRIIKSSTASNGTSVILTLYYPLAYALADGDGLEICRSIYADVEQTNLSADPTFESIACVPMMGPVTAGYYFWGLTWGMVTLAVSANVGLVGGQRLVTFNPADGTMRPYVAGEQIAGYLIPSTTGPAAQTIIMLQLDP